jgi:2-amino-4-hydroxy-6-hydroxymethyldihydropteridine diphosphokinase
MAERGFRFTRASSVWETPPFPEGQPRFYNGAVRGETALTPEELLSAAKECERALGRTPTYRWGPRAIDVDILFYGDLAIDTPPLTIPHPRIAERAFVLVPLAEIWDGPLPVLGETVRDLLGRLSTEGIVPTNEHLA